MTFQKKHFSLQSTAKNLWTCGICWHTKHVDRLTSQLGIIFLSAATSSTNHDPRNHWDRCLGNESPDRRDL
jgi:hypothetical protein